MKYALLTTNQTVIFASVSKVSVVIVFFLQPFWRVSNNLKLHCEQNPKWFERKLKYYLKTTSKLCFQVHYSMEIVPVDFTENQNF